MTSAGLTSSPSMPLIQCSGTGSHQASPMRNRTFLQPRLHEHGPECSNRAVLADNLRKLRSNTQRLQMQRQDGCLANLTGGKSQTILVSGQDAKLKFTIEPRPGEDAFNQWRDGMRAVARLPNGIPVEFRRKVWLSLAESYLASQRLDWQRIRKLCFNDRLNPDDDSLDHQIVKDLHRTGCEEFGSEHDRAVLKRVLLAYARWNKRVGYCQGFNVLAALILEVMERNEDESLKVMIFLVDSCLPESYFAQNLQALTVDMAVFRQLLRAHLPQLSSHLDRLQTVAVSGHLASPATLAAGYEPPLVNVFTIQWFLTLFSTCLPAFATLRLWDAIMLEGSEMLLHCALVLWRKLQAKILKETDSADAFYCHMGEITALLNSETLITTEQLIDELYASMSEIPSGAIAEMRERFTFNIKPFSAPAGGRSDRSARSRSGKSGGRGDSAYLSGNDDEDDLDMLGGGGGGGGSGNDGSANGHTGSAGSRGGGGSGGSLGIGCFSAAFRLAGGSSGNAPLPHSASAGGGLSDLSALQQQSSEGASRDPTSGLPRTELERRNTNLNNLLSNYRRLQHRQMRASLVIASGGGSGAGNSAGSGGAVSGGTGGSGVEQPVMNHLLLGRPNSVSTSASTSGCSASPPPPAAVKAAPASASTPTTPTAAVSPASPANSASSPRRPETLLAMVSRRLDTDSSVTPSVVAAASAVTAADASLSPSSSTKTPSPSYDCLDGALGRAIDRQRAAAVKATAVKAAEVKDEPSSSGTLADPDDHSPMTSGFEDGGSGSREWLSSTTAAAQPSAVVSSSASSSVSAPGSSSAAAAAVAMNPHLLRGSRLRFGAQFGLYKSVRTQLQQPASLTHH